MFYRNNWFLLWGSIAHLLTNRTARALIPIQYLIEPLLFFDVKKKISGPRYEFVDFQRSLTARIAKCVPMQALLSDGLGVQERLAFHVTGQKLTETGMIASQY